MRDDLDITNSKMFKLPFKEFLYKSMSVLQSQGLIDDEDNIEYSYTDKRQLELFSDDDFEYDPSYAEHCK
jgi:hypothetical protein